MTLNITVVSPDAIYQSSDFRLVGFSPDVRGQYVPIDNSSPKLITLSYEKWKGFLTYCGVGKWNHEATYESAEKWIAKLGFGASFDDVANCIVMEGSIWINDIQRVMNKFQAHTFILAAFDHDRPRISLISNTHSTKGAIARTSGSGLKLSFGSDAGTHVYVTGIDNAVPKESRINVKRLVEKQIESNVVRHRLSQINAMASKSVEARNGISAACMCYSINRLGDGGGEIYGDLKGRFLPLQLTNGVNLLKGLNLGPNAQLRASSFSSSASSNAAGAEHIECSLGEMRGGHRLTVVGHDLGQMNDQHVRIASANMQHSVVGQLRRPINAIHQAFIWIDGGDMQLLPPLHHEGYGQAQDVNSSNEVVGASLTQEREWRAVLWRPGEPAQNLGSLVANNSTAKAMNDQCVIVGDLYQSPATPQMSRHHMFKWSSTEGMTLIPGVEDVWTQAMDINNRGELLGWCRGEQIRSFIWSSDYGLRFVDGPAGEPFYAVCINDLGVVVGEVDDGNGTRRAMTWSFEHGFSELAVPFQFHPAAIDLRGNVVGRDAQHPWTGAWLVTAQGEVVSLPAGKDHNVDVCSVANGSIFGHAQKGGWKHLHPIRWDFG